MSPDLWSDAGQVAGTVVRTVIVYAVALAAVRIAGRRTLAQFSAFDIIVTVAAGTVVGAAALPSHPAVSDGLAVLLTLFALQVALGALRQRVPAARRWLDFRPRVVVRDGQPDLDRSLTSAQLTRGDLLSRLREQGVTDLSTVRLAVLEPSGKVSLLDTGLPDQDPAPEAGQP